MRATGFLTGTVALGLLLAGSLAAQQAAAPKDATGQCTDSSYTTAKTQARGCLKHGGVKTWFAAAPAAAPAPAASASASTSAPTKSTAGKSTADQSQPKDATGQCTDGSYTTAKTQARGCLKHGGVKTWFGAEASAAAPAAPAAQPTPTAPTVVKAAAKPARATAPGTTPAQAPSNPTDVWVNLSTKAYHCPGTKYYGATKHGKYMSEADAKVAGFHPSYGKACS
ncbi:MAG: signal peptide protein [Gemmatimonadales bacterium]